MLTAALSFFQPTLPVRQEQTIGSPRNKEPSQMNEEFSGIEEQLILHEGLRLKPYRCTAGKLTIGVGRNLDDVGITQDEAMYLLRSDVARCARDLRNRLPWFDSLDAIRQRVLLDMAFNLGIKGLLSFKNTLEFVRKGEWKSASENMLKSKWAKQVGRRAVRLSTMMMTGKDYI
jgi:lysozyme